MVIALEPVVIKEPLLHFEVIFVSEEIQGWAAIGGDRYQKWMAATVTHSNRLRMVLLLLNLV